MGRIQRTHFANFTSTLPANADVNRWEAAIEEWNNDPTKPDPYEETRPSTLFATFWWHLHGTY